MGRMITCMQYLSLNLVIYSFYSLRQTTLKVLIRKYGLVCLHIVQRIEVLHCLERSDDCKKTIFQKMIEQRKNDYCQGHHHSVSDGEAYKEKPLADQTFQRIAALLNH